jgi:hypothetical protein
MSQSRYLEPAEELTGYILDVTSELTCLLRLYVLAEACACITQLSFSSHNETKQVSWAVSRLTCFREGKSFISTVEQFEFIVFS